MSTNDKVYLVLAQRECDDPYYRPYTDFLAVFRSRQLAVENAKHLYERSKEYMDGDDCYIVNEVQFADEKEHKNSSGKHVYVIDREGHETVEF